MCYDHADLDYEQYKAKIAEILSFDRALVPGDEQWNPGPPGWATPRTFIVPNPDHLLGYVASTYIVNAIISFGNHRGIWLSYAQARAALKEAANAVNDVTGLVGPWRQDRALRWEKF